MRKSFVFNLLSLENGGSSIEQHIYDCVGGELRDKTNEHLSWHTIPIHILIPPCQRSDFLQQARVGFS